MSSRTGNNRLVQTWALRLGAIVLMAIALSVFFWSVRNAALVFSAECHDQLGWRLPVWRLSRQAVGEFLICGAPILFLRTRTSLMALLVFLIVCCVLGGFYAQASSMSGECLPGSPAKASLHRTGWWAAMLLAVTVILLWITAAVEILLPYLRHIKPRTP